MARDSVFNSLKVATILCFVCSVLVSASAVGLRERQEKNKELYKKRNVLMAAGLIPKGDEGKKVPNEDVEYLFSEIDAKIVDLKTGKYTDKVTPEEYDQREASSKDDLSAPLDSSEDIAGIKRRERYAYVYLVRDENKKISQYILPIRGYGLWSTMYGFLALNADTTTVEGITFYEDGETPGLGAEINNQKWQEQWKGKQVYGDDWEPKLAATKGSTGKTKYEVDALSGATITSNGVTNMIAFWLGDSGYGPYLERQREQAE